MSRDCKNDNCVRHDPKSEHYGCTLGPDCYGCPKYRDTPPPKPFTPKNPDDYIPGCRNKECMWNKRTVNHLCNFASHISSHLAICERLPCYDPAPKPKTREVAVVRLVIENGLMIGASKGNMSLNSWTPEDLKAHLETESGKKFKSLVDSIEIITEEIVDDKKS